MLDVVSSLLHSVSAPDHEVVLGLADAALPSIHIQAGDSVCGLWS